MDPIEYQQWVDQFEKKGQNIYYLGRKVIPWSLVSTIISIHHDDPTAAYQSKDVVYNLIKGRYTWQGMYKDIREYVQTCWECQHRGNTKHNNIKRTITPSGLFKRWRIDIVGPLPVTERGHRYIVCAVDYFSWWPEARALKAANAETVATFIYEEIICQHGPPEII